MATILIADDNPTICMLFSCAFSDHHTVIEANNGKEALALVTQHQPDLIVTDLRMPGMNGLEFIATLRASNSKVKILVHACFSIHLPAELLALGADRCLAKPADLHILKQTVEQLLTA